MADVAIGAKAIDMALGVIHSPPPPLFSKLLCDLSKERSLSIYASPAGFLPYREAVLASVQAEGAAVSLEMIMATNGVTGGLLAALTVECTPGERVLLLEPFYPAHDWLIRSLGLVPVYLPTVSGSELDLTALAATLPTVSAFILANPANPTGALLSAHSLMTLYDLCCAHEVLLIIDEVYKDFIWENTFSSLLSLTTTWDHLVITRSFSKNLGLAGWRVGYALTTPERRAAMTHTHDAFYVGAPQAGQVIMAHLLTKHGEAVTAFVADLTDLYRHNRGVITSLFQALGMVPQPGAGAFYMMVRHNRESDMLAMYELLSHGVAVAPGVPFFRPGTLDTGFLRIHFALSAADRKRVVETLLPLTQFPLPELQNEVNSQSTA